MLSVIQPTRGEGSVQVHPPRPEELRHLRSITSCSAAGLTSTDANTFAWESPLRGLWVPQGENCQLWASPSWAVMPGSPGELRRGFHLLSECTPRAAPPAHCAGAQGRYRRALGTSSTGNQRAHLTHRHSQAWGVRCERLWGFLAVSQG